jgi:hypothetical protein
LRGKSAGLGYSRIFSFACMVPRTILYYSLKCDARKL